MRLKTKKFTKIPLTGYINYTIIKTEEKGFAKDIVFDTDAIQRRAGGYHEGFRSYFYFVFIFISDLRL